MTECLASCSETLGLMISKAPKGQTTPVHKMFKCVESGLSFQYHAAWGLILQILASVFDILGKTCHPIMKGVSEAHNVFITNTDLDSGERFATDIGGGVVAGKFVRR